MTDRGRETLIVGSRGPGKSTLMEVCKDDLPTRMVALADRDGLPLNHLMRIRAAELEAKLDCMSPGWTAQNMIGAWARARRVWCDYTGEPML